jgi:DNA-binding transcriptional regulator GbsR (MarR family)
VSEAREVEEKYLYLARCLGVGDAELVGKILETLAKSEGKRVAVRDLVNTLMVSYPTISRLVNELEAIGVVKAEKERGARRKPGRPRKVIEADWDALKAKARECVEVLSAFLKE